MGAVRNVNIFSLPLTFKTGLDFVKKSSIEAAARVEGVSETPVTDTRDSDPRQHAIFVDVDAKDNTTGIMFPPQPFLAKDFLETMYSWLRPEGRLVCGACMVVFVVLLWSG